MKKNISLLVIVMLLAGCSMSPKIYYNRGDPENLVDISSEVVTLNLTSPDSLRELIARISQDTPTRVLLNCPAANALCANARDYFARQNLAAQWVTNQSGSKPNVTLIYDHITARDCLNRYVDDTGTPRNLPPPTFGCSITGNMVQEVSDKRQFVSPNLLDFEDGNKAAQNYDRYLAPSAGSAQSASPMAIYPAAVYTGK